MGKIEMDGLLLIPTQKYIRLRKIIQGRRKRLRQRATAKVAIVFIQIRASLLKMFGGYQDDRD